MSREASLDWARWRSWGGNRSMTRSIAWEALGAWPVVSIRCPVSAIDVHVGVGCATAIMVGAIRGTEPTCDCKGGPCA